MTCPTETLLRPREVATITAASTPTVLRWIRTGQLEAVRLGESRCAHLRVERQALDVFLHQTAARGGKR